MDGHLLPLVEANGKACFAALPQPMDRSSLEYVDCLEHSITGCGVPAANFSCPGPDTLAAPIWIEPLERAPMVAAWEEAFMEPADGGCPGLL
jgi:hypothetical protein